MSSLFQKKKKKKKKKNVRYHFALLNAALLKRDSLHLVGFVQGRQLY